MCLILLAHQYSTQWPLVVAANRDEFYSRPAREAGFWTEDSLTRDLLAGKDLTQGGSWLGMSRAGRFAAVTNIRDPSRSAPGSRSRGSLTVDFLSGSVSPMAYLESLRKQRADFSGFNLLVGNSESLGYLNSDSGEMQELPQGIYGISNGKLDDPWPKVTRGKLLLKQMLDASSSVYTDDLLQIMTDKQTAAEHELPDTGITPELEKILSASFITNSERGYGTRCSTAIIVNAGGLIRFSEQNYSRDSSINSRHFYSFQKI